MRQAGRQRTGKAIPEKRVAGWRLGALIDNFSDRDSPAGRGIRLTPDAQREWSAIGRIQEDLRFALPGNRPLDMKGFSHSEDLRRSVRTPGLAQQVANQGCQLWAGLLLRIRRRKANLGGTSGDGPGKDNHVRLDELGPFAARIGRHVCDVADSRRKAVFPPNHGGSICRYEVTPLSRGHIAGKVSLQLFRLADADLGHDRGRQGKVCHVCIGQQDRKGNARGFLR